MEDATKLSNLKTILGFTDTSHDAELTVYLSLTAQEILNWKYSCVGGVPTDVTSVPAADEVTQILACAAGYGHKGAPDQVTHSENGIARTWKHADMVAYVRTHVTIIAGTGG